MLSTMIPVKRDLANRTPTGVFSELRSDWDRLFDRFLDDMWGPPTGGALAVPLDLAETDEELRIRAEVPGVAPDGLEIQLVGDVLTLSGTKLDPAPEARTRQLHAERRFGSFQRAVRLPCAVDPDGVAAEHANGVVTVTLRKAETVRPKRIAVRPA